MMKKKDGKKLNVILERTVYEDLKAYSEDKGQTMTLALERILRSHFDEWRQEKENSI